MLTLTAERIVSCPNWLNKSAALIVCGALALVACSRDSPVVSTGRGGERGVAIPDAKLHAAIANELGKTSNAPITASEMATLSHLFALDSETGLEYAINLTTLQLYNNRVSNPTTTFRLPIDHNRISRRFVFL